VVPELLVAELYSVDPTTQGRVEQRAWILSVRTGLEDEVEHRAGQAAPTIELSRRRRGGTPVGTDARAVVRRGPGTAAPPRDGSRGRPPPAPAWAGAGRRLRPGWGPAAAPATAAALEA